MDLPYFSSIMFQNGFVGCVTFVIIFHKMNLNEINKAKIRRALTSFIFTMSHPEAYQDTVAEDWYNPNIPR